MYGMPRPKGWDTIAAWRRHARRLKTTTLRQSSLEPNVIYTPGRLAGWPGPERWAVTRAGVHVGTLGVYNETDD